MGWNPSVAVRESRCEKAWFVEVQQEANGVMENTSLEVTVDFINFRTTTGIVFTPNLTV